MAGGAVFYLAVAVRMAIPDQSSELIYIEVVSTRLKLHSLSGNLQ